MADEHLIETPLASQTLVQGNFLLVKRDRIRLPDGREATREFVVHPGAVMIVPLLDDGRVVVERQYRYPVGRVMLEFPAGKLDAGEGGKACAVRELIEETGYRAAEWAYAGVMHNAIAYSTEGIQVWFARGLTSGERQLDVGEHLDVLAMDVEELDRLSCSGELTDAKTLVGLLWLHRWRAGAWPLAWEPADLASGPTHGGAPD